METVTISKAEYEQLMETLAKVELIEEVLHLPELSIETKHRLTKARAVPDSELLSQEEIKY